MYACPQNFRAVIVWLAIIRKGRSNNEMKKYYFLLFSDARSIYFDSVMGTAWKTAFFSWQCQTLKGFRIYHELLIICTFMLPWVRTMTYGHWLWSYKWCWVMASKRLFSFHTHTFFFLRRILFAAIKNKVTEMPAKIESGISYIIFHGTDTSHKEIQLNFS